jgi:cyclopropane fatty-acyl-phospholipid synthase-like methyltransferase
MEQTTAWDAIFRRQGSVWTGPQEDMPGLLAVLRAQGAGTLLDLGCGTGRHVVYFAQHGLSVHGLDNAPEGLRLTERALRAAGLTARLVLQDMYAPLPYAGASVDAIIAIQVIHHARTATIRRLVGELERVLRPGGTIFVSVPSLRDQGTRFEEIEPGTLVPLDGREAGLPHHFFTPDELRAVFAQFDVRDIHLDSTGHYCLLAGKPS